MTDSRWWVVAFALVASLLVVTMPAVASHTVVVSTHTTAGELSSGSLSNAEVERSGTAGYVGHDTYASSAVARWAFDAGSGSTAYDHVGSNDGTINGASWAAGRKGQALDFDGSNDEVTISGSGDEDASGEITVSAWVNLQSINSYQTVIAKGAFVSSSDLNFGLQVVRSGLSNGDKIRFTFQDSNSNFVGVTSNGSVAGKGWVHVAGVYDDAADEMRIYINGSLSNTETTTKSLVSNSNPITIGAGRENDGTYRSFSYGKIDEPRVYSEALTPGEVRRLAEAPGAKLSPTADEHWAGDAGLGETVYGDDGRDGTLKGGGEENHAWMFNEGTGGTAYDLAGSADGTLNNGPVWSQDRGGSIDLDGSDDHVQLPDLGLSASSSFTVSMWFRPNATQDSMLFARYDGTSDLVFVRTTAEGGVGFRIGENDGGSLRINDAGSYDSGQWNHVAAVYDAGAGEARLYLNGEFVGSDSSGYDDFADPAGPEIGRREGDSSGPFAGSIDGVRVYDSRTLTPGEVTRLYNEAEVRHDPSASERWAMDAGTGSTAYGDEGNDGTLTGASSWSNGVSGGGVSFAGGSGTIGISQPSVSGDYTITVWVKGRDVNETGLFAESSFSNATWIGTNAADEYIPTWFDGGLSIKNQLPSSKWDNWVLLAFRWNGSKASIWHNGTQIAAGDFGYRPDPPTLFGDNSNRDGNATLDEVRVYDKSLSKQELNELHRSSPIRQLPPVEHYGNEWADGVSGDALRFEGKSEWAGADYQVPSTYTVSFWAKPTLEEDNVGFFSAGSADGGTSYLSVYQRDFDGDGANNELVVRTTDGSNANAVSATDALKADTWQYITVRVTGDGGEVEVLVNGTQVANGTAHYSSNADRVNIGRRIAAATNNINATIDDVRVFGSMLSNEEIDYLMDNPPAQLNETSRYTSAAHSATSTVSGWADLELENATATVKWQGSTDGGSSWSTLASATVSSSQNLTQSWGTFGGDDVRVTVEFTPTDPRYLAKLHDEGVSAQRHAPTVDNSSLSPNSTSESVSSIPVTLTASVDDADFPTADGDSVNVSFYVDGQYRTSKTITSSGDVSVQVSNVSGGTHNWYVKLEDSQGHTTTSATASFVMPSSLEIRKEESPGELVNNVTVDIKFYFADGSTTIITRQTQDGTINMTGVPADQPFVVVADADGYYPRRIYVESLAETQRVYLLNTTYQHVDRIYSLTDLSGSFPPEETVMQLQRAINGSWQTVEGDFFGATNEFSAQLRYNTRHRLVLINTETGERRVAGTTTPISDGTKTIQVQANGSIEIESLGALLTVSPATRALPATSVDVVEATVENQTGEQLAWWNITMVAQNATSSDVVYSVNETTPGGGTAEPSLNLTGWAGGNLTVVATWKPVGGTVTTDRETFRLSQAYQNQYSLLSGLGDIETNLVAGTAGTFTALVALALTVLVTGAVASNMPVSSETAGLAALGVMGGFAIVGWLDYTVVFAAGTAWVVFVGLGRRL